MELLATIVIIFALASLLFHVMGNAKAAASVPPCQNNLHNLGLASALYQADYDDHYPYGINGFERFVSWPLGAPPGTDKSVAPLQFDAVKSYLEIGRASCRERV